MLCSTQSAKATWIVVLLMIGLVWATQELSPDNLAALYSQKVIGKDFFTANVKPGEEQVIAPDVGPDDYVLNIRSSKIHRVKGKRFDVKWQPTLKVQGLESGSMPAPVFTCRDFRLQSNCPKGMMDSFEDGIDDQPCSSMDACGVVCCLPKVCKNIMRKNVTCLEGFTLDKSKAHRDCDDKKDCQSKCCSDTTCCDHFDAGNKCKAPLVQMESKKARQTPCGNKKTCDKMCCVPPKLTCGKFYKESFCPEGMHKRPAATHATCRGKKQCLTTCCCKCNKTNCEKYQCSKGGEKKAFGKGEAKEKICYDKKTCDQKCCVKSEKEEPDPVDKTAPPKPGAPKAAPKPKVEKTDG